MADEVTRKGFMAGVASGPARPRTLLADEGGAAEGLRLRFLGTGAADWEGRDERGELRRLTSVLVDGKILVDYTGTAKDMLPEGCRPEAILYTHSHGDHYQPLDAVRLGVKRAYVHESWAEGARAEFARLARPGETAVEVVPLRFGEPVEVGGVRFTSVPANHGTGRRGELASMYLVEKGKTRLLYATDTGGIPCAAARIAGIDVHRKGAPITALVMEATMGVGHEDDFRIFTHSSVDTVARTVRVLLATGRYTPAPGQKVYLTHLARTLHGTQKEVEAAVPAPLAPAYDGLEITL